MEIREGYKKTEVGIIPKEWEALNIGEIVKSISSGKSKTQSQIMGNIPIYGSTGLIGLSIEPDYEGEKILVARVGANAGAIYCVNGKYCVSDNTLIIQAGNKVDFNFLYNLLKYYNLNKMVFGSGQPLITGTQIKNLLVPVPTLPEQKAIATALSVVDKLICSINKLIDKKKKIKQGAMQELLSGKKRLKGFNDEWIETKLGDVCDILNGDRGINYPSPSDFVTTGIPFINAGHLKNNKIDFSNMDFITNEKFSSFGSGKINMYDILFCLRGSLGKYALVQIDKGVIASSLAILRTKQEFLIVNYLLQLLGSNIISKHILKENNGSSQPNLSATSVKNFSVFIPNLNEQIAISSVLSDMDYEIEKLEQKLIKYKQIKQGMMQELLSGRIRLV